MTAWDLTTYTGLKAALADELNRSDLTDQIPGAIALAEAEMARRLRIASTRANLTISTLSTALPAGCRELRSVKLTTADFDLDVPVQVCTYEEYANVKALSNSTGRPIVATLADGTLLVAPAPDQTYTAEIVYYTVFAPLSGSVSSNQVLVNAPDAYFYGALLHLAPFLEHDERVGTFQPRFDTAIEQLRVEHDSQEFGASFKRKTLPVVF